MALVLYLFIAFKINRVITMTIYAFPPGGLPDQKQNPAGTAVFRPAYAVVPSSVMCDIVISRLPGWDKTRSWILARPLTGFAETFAQYAVEVAYGGGSKNPEPDPSAEAVIFVASGRGTLLIAGRAHDLRPGSYAYLPPGINWQIQNTQSPALQFHWIRKRYEPLADNTPPPNVIITHDSEVKPTPMPTTDAWTVTNFIDTSDLAYDMHVSIINFRPGGRIPFAETHVMEHGLYVLEGQASYLLNTDWVEVGAGDFIWLRAFCPQACIAKADSTFRYLLYKDVNRHPKLQLF